MAVEITAFSPRLNVLTVVMSQTLSFVRHTVNHIHIHEYRTRTVDSIRLGCASKPWTKGQLKIRPITKMQLSIWPAGVTVCTVYFGSLSNTKQTHTVWIHTIESIFGFCGFFSWGIVSSAKMQWCCGSPGVQFLVFSSWCLLMQWCCGSPGVQFLVFSFWCLLMQWCRGSPGV